MNENIFWIWKEQQMLNSFSSFVNESKRYVFPIIGHLHQMQLKFSIDHLDSVNLLILLSF